MALCAEPTHHDPVERLRSLDIPISDPNASTTPAFMVIGTTTNGNNNQGDLVGFNSNGTQVIGLVALPIRTSLSDAAHRRTLWFGRLRPPPQSWLTAHLDSERRV
jgi:hypothetical protein